MPESGNLAWPFHETPLRLEERRTIFSFLSYSYALFCWRGEHLAMSSVTSFSLDGDGLVENLFHYLWAKDELDCGPVGINLPDTVIYRYRQPSFWYFTGKSGKLKRKNRGNLSNANILDSFLKKRSGLCDIVAYHICQVDDDAGKELSWQKHMLG